MTSFKGYSTDVVALRVFHALLRDFRTVHGQNFAAGAEHALNTSIAEFRSYEWPRVGFVEPSRFKAWHQLRNLFKRHIFSRDVYTTDELKAKTTESFCKAQEEFAAWRGGSPRTHAVLQEARRIARNILGDVSMDEVASYVQIGRRATLGGPLHQAFLDRKVGDPAAFTCPTAARQWFFKDYLPNYPALQRAVRKVFRKAKRDNIPVNLAADYLKLVNVPKSWKTLRSITPLSLIGLFLSYGIGGVVTERLRSAGLDIKRLQAEHRGLAKRYSISRSHVTADLSRASDSIMSQHLNAVLPRQWYRLLKLTFVRELHLDTPDEQRIYNCSVLPMGNGATFPVETLFFYCIITAVGNLLKVNGTYSVYGDDLIYPKRVHAYVRRVFVELGITLNEDKTFVDSYFRESCGGDYYRGVDVRPALLPEVEMSHLKGKRYAAYLYKVANALRARWADEEIPTTIQYLLREIAVTQRVIYQVPMHFPATSGWKVHEPAINVSWWEPWYVPRIRFIHGCVQIRFKYLGMTTPELRPVESEDVYLWDCLRSMSMRQPLEWRWWKTWLVQVPTRETPVGSHTVFKWLRLRSKGGVEQVIAEPSKKSGGYTVVDELLSKEFWMQDIL